MEVAIILLGYFSFSSLFMEMEWQSSLSLVLKSLQVVQLHSPHSFPNTLTEFEIWGDFILKEKRAWW
jgi:hypothetical protein